MISNHRDYFNKLSDLRSLLISSVTSRISGGYPPSGLRIPGPVYQSPISSDEVQGVFHNNCGFPPRTFISQYPCLASTWLLESANGTDCTFEFCCSDQAAKNELQFFFRNTQFFWNTLQRSSRWALQNGMYFFEKNSKVEEF